MTWYFDPTDQTADVYDQTGTRVDTDVPVSSWSVDDEGRVQDPPTAVLDVMQAEAEAEYQANGFSGRLLGILRDAIFNDIEEGTP